MTIVFWNSSPKITKQGTFGPKFRHFHYFTIISNYTNSRVLIWNTTIVLFKILAQKYPNTAFLVKNTQARHFWPQIETFLFFREILKLNKFEGTDFKYDNIVFKFQPKNIQISYLWSQVYVFLFFHEICNKTNLGVVISNMTTGFSNSNPKIHK